eukprot:5350960-Prymnesium_polylepis.1
MSQKVLKACAALHGGHAPQCGLARPSLTSLRLAPVSSSCAFCVGPCDVLGPRTTPGARHAKAASGEDGSCGGIGGAGGGRRDAGTKRAAPVAFTTDAGYKVAPGHMVGSPRQLSLVAETAACVRRCKAAGA